jgi:hypothetical protein
VTGKTVLLMGAGAVGQHVANYLACYRSVDRLVVADMDLGRTRSVAGNTEMCAHYLGNYPSVEAKTIDLRDESPTVRLLQEVSPSVVFNSTTMFPCSYYTPIVKMRIAELGLHSYYPGHTIAKDLVLIHKLMRAVREAKVSMKVVNAAFPDNTHPVLAKVGLSPTIGSGNVDNLAMNIRKVAAGMLGVPAHNLSVTLISHHAISLSWVDPTKVPYYLRIRIGENDLTNRFDGNALIVEGNNLPVNDEQMAAISSVRMIMSILEDRGEIVHGAGVNGIPGCVTARLDGRGAEVILPDDLTMDRVIEMNLAGMRFDGIERVEDNGTVEFTEETVEFLRHALGIEWKKMKLSEAEDMTRDLTEAYGKLWKKYS